MNNEQEERLKQELTFLKESLEADVISRDEYERGKERIERKLKELSQKSEISEGLETKSQSEEPGEIKETEEKPQVEAIEPESQKSSISEGLGTKFQSEKQEEKVEEKEEIKEEPKIEIKEIKEEPTKIIGAEEGKPQEKEEPKVEEPTIEEKKPEESQKSKISEGLETKSQSEPEEEIVISKKWIYGIAILIIIAILFFSIRSWTRSDENTIEEPIEGELIGEIEEFTPECSSDSDCKKQGMIGICLNPDTKEATCEFKEDISTNLMVINDKDCKLCDSSRTKTIVKEIFPNVKITDIDYETEEAKELLNKLGINALPAYIFDSDVSEAINFNDFKTALIKEENNYIITNTASGSNYYFKRPLIENRLDLYLSETNEKIESSMQEVMDLFKDKIQFTKKIVTEREKGFLEKELAINTYPTFLLNNQIKFRGILPADTIKEKICQINDFEECSQELSKI